MRIMCLLGSFDTYFRARKPQQEPFKSADMIILKDIREIKVRLTIYSERYDA